MIGVFLLLVFGLLDVARLVFVNNALSESAREGARWGSVQGRSRDAAGRTAIGTYTISTLAAVPNPTVTVSCQDVDGVVQVTCVTNDVLIVEAKTTLNMITPIVSEIMGSRVLVATSRVVVNQ